MVVAHIFGRVLRTTREQHGLSQEQLGLESGYHRTYISMLERGQKTPTLTTMLRLAKVLNVSAAEWVQEIEIQIHQEESRLQAGLQAAFAIPFIDDVEDFVWEAIFAYAKNIPLPDPLFNTRYKTLFDVVDPISPERIGWSAKTLMWAVAPNIEFELVVQRADIFSKATQLGFETLTLSSPTHLLGAALLQHWNQKVLEDAIRQQVTEKRVAILLKSRNYRRFACYETDLRLYTSDELEWRWTSEDRRGLQGIVKATGFVAFRWYSNQKQLFERFRLPPEVKIFELEPKRLPLPEVVQVLLDRLGKS